MSKKTKLFLSTLFFAIALLSIIVFADPNPAPPQISHTVPGTLTSSEYNFAEDSFFGGGDVTIQHWVFYFSAPLADYILQQAKIKMTVPQPNGDPIERIEFDFDSPSQSHLNCALLTYSPETGLYDQVDVGARPDAILDGIDWIIAPHFGSNFSKDVEIEFYAIWRCPKDLTNFTRTPLSTPDTVVDLDLSNPNNNLSRPTRYHFPQFEDPFGWTKNKTFNRHYNTSNETQIPDEKIGFLFGNDKDQKYAFTFFDRQVSPDDHFLVTAQIQPKGKTKNFREELEKTKAVAYFSTRDNDYRKQIINKSMGFSLFEEDSDHPYAEFSASLKVPSEQSTSHFFPVAVITFPDGSEKKLKGDVVLIAPKDTKEKPLKDQSKHNTGSIIIVSVILGLLIGYWLAAKKRRT